MKIRTQILLVLLSVCTLLQAQTLYWGGGTTDISNGTAIPTSVAGLTGTWDNTTQNWSSALSPTVYAPWTSGAVANLGYFTDASGNAVLTVDGNKTISGLFASLTPALSFNRDFLLNGAAAGTTLTLAGPTATFLVSSADTTRGLGIGSNNSGSTQLSLGASSTTLIKDGGGRLNLGNGTSFVSSDDFTGDVLIRAGTFNIGAQSSLAGVTAFDVIGYRPSITSGNANGNQSYSAPSLSLNPSNTAGTINRIHDNAVITLSRGTLTLVSGGANKPIENIGSVVLQGTGFIANSQGTANGAVWNIGTLSRGTDGRGTAVVTVDNTDVMRHDIRITTPGAIPTDVLLPWLSTGRGEWLMIDSSNNNQLTRIASTNANLDAAVWDSTYTGTSNVRINGVMTNSVDANLELNSLSFLGTGTASNFNLGGNTLTINAGALGLGPSGNVAYTISNGTIQTPGSTPLFLNTGNSNSSNLVLDSVLTGNMDIYISGITNATFGPIPAAVGTANDYVGTVYVNSGTLNVNKDAAITGDVVVASGGGVVLNRNAGLAASSNLTLGREALLATGSTTPTFSGVITSNGGQIILANTAGLTFNNPGTGLVFNGGLLTQSSTAAGTVNLLTNLSYASSSELQAVIQRFNTGGFNFNLNTGASVGNAERTFAIADSNTLAADQAEMVVDNIISNGGSGSTTGSIRKTGDGTLQFTAANTFTGGLVIDAGTVQLGRIQAAAQSGLTATFTNSGNEADVLTFTSPITGGMVVGQAVTGTGVATGRIIAGILNEYQVMLNGTGGTNNAVATDISVGAVDRIGSLASAVTVNGGTLLLDGGTSVNNTVTVNTGGILAGTGTITGATGITGSLRPGHSIGTLTVTNDVTWNSSAVVADAWVFELGTAAIDQATAASGGSTQDVLDITGDFLQGTPGNAWTFDFAGTGSEGWYKLVNWTGTTGFVAGDFTATNLGGSLSGSFEIDGGSLYLAVIPEPGTLTLVGVAMLSLLAFRRRK